MQWNSALITYNLTVAERQTHGIAIVRVAVARSLYFCVQFPIGGLTREGGKSDKKRKGRKGSTLAVSGLGLFSQKEQFLFYLNASLQFSNYRKTKRTAAEGDSRNKNVESIPILHKVFASKWCMAI